MGGCAIRLTDAINKYTEHESRHLCTSTQVFDYKKDIYTKDGPTIIKWINWADVVNCWESLYPLAIVGMRGNKIKNLVITYVGSNFTSNPRRRYGEGQGYGPKKQLVTGFWMSAMGGLNLDCQPGPIPVDDWLKLKSSHKGKPIVCQSPSSFRMKNTKKIREQLLANKNIELKIISGVRWSECLRLKASADIYVGPFIRGYGLSELEAMAMKIPVITHTYEGGSEKAILDNVGYLPYYDCEIEDLPEAVDALLNDKKLYEKQVKLGFDYVKKFQDSPVVAKNFIKIFESIM